MEQALQEWLGGLQCNENYRGSTKNNVMFVHIKSFYPKTFLLVCCLAMHMTKGERIRKEKQVAEEISHVTSILY